MRSILPALAVGLFATAAQAGPFGIDRGASIESLGPTEGPNASGVFMLKNPPPKPHPAFSMYAVEAEAQVGVCGVKGGTSPGEHDPGGSEIRGKFADLKRQLL